MEKAETKQLKDFDLNFWTLYNRVSYRIGEWDSPEWSHKERDSYRDSYITELERAHKVFADNPELSDKLPDDRCDPIIGLRKIWNLCHQIINEKVEKTTQTKPAETGRNNAPAKDEKANLKIEIGEIQAENVQIGNHASIHKQPKEEKKNKGGVKKLLKIIGTIIVGLFVAFLADIFGNLGWTERITDFIYRIFLSK